MPKASAQKKVVLGVLASGRGSNLQAILDAIDEGRLRAAVGVVLSDKKEAAVLDRAREHDIPAVHLDPKDYPNRDAYDQASVEILKKHDVELVILAGYMRIITKGMVAAFRNRIMNIHPSLLPSFPGLSAQRQAIEHRVKVSGCTVHFVDDQVDHGPIIIQAAVPVYHDDTEKSLSARILRQEHQIYPRVIQLYAEGRLTVSGRRVIVKGRRTAEEETLLNPPRED